MSERLGGTVYVLELRNKGGVRYVGPYATRKQLFAATHLVIAQGDQVTLLVYDLHHRESPRDPFDADEVRAAKREEAAG